MASNKDGRKLSKDEQEVPSEVRVLNISGILIKKRTLREGALEERLAHIRRESKGESKGRTKKSVDAHIRGLGSQGLEGLAKRGAHPL